jgi:hypothetical protein
VKASPILLEGTGLFADVFRFVRALSVDKHHLLTRLSMLLCAVRSPALLVDVGMRSSLFVHSFFQSRTFRHFLQVLAPLFHLDTSISFAVA